MDQIMGPIIGKIRTSTKKIRTSAKQHLPGNVCSLKCEILIRIIKKSDLGLMTNTTQLLSLKFIHLILK